jgi:regulator of protease activity HflC (stomatin/prohibitin superfamily)
LGEVELDELLAAREKLNARLQDILDRQTDRWGIKVSLVEIKGVDLPQEMRRAMSRQAEAEREKRAKIIHADGEYQAAEKLVSAASTIATEPVAIQLRYLQTLTEIGVEQNTTVVFPLPLQILEGLTGLLGKEKVEPPVARSAKPVTVSRNETHDLQR